MSDEATRFQLNLNGIVLEIEGDRPFVEAMYREVMKDIEEARRRMLAPKPAAAPVAAAPPGGQRAVSGSSIASTNPQGNPRVASPSRARAQQGVVWIHRCNELVHKIYMGSPQDLRTHPIFDIINPERVGILYIEDPLINQVLPRFESGQTLWAELTPAGRKKIAEAAGPHRKSK
jgi:hypothetical protein